MQKEEEPKFWHGETAFRNLRGKPVKEWLCTFPTRVNVKGEWKYMEPGKRYDDNIEEIKG